METKRLNVAMELFKSKRRTRRHLGSDHPLEVGIELSPWVSNDFRVSSAKRGIQLAK